MYTERVSYDDDEDGICIISFTTYPNQTSAFPIKGLLFITVDSLFNTVLIVPLPFTHGAIFFL